MVDTYLEILDILAVLSSANLGIHTSLYCSKRLSNLGLSCDALSTLIFSHAVTLTYSQREP